MSVAPEAFSAESFTVFFLLVNRWKDSAVWFPKSFEINAKHAREKTCDSRATTGSRRNNAL